MRGLESGNCFVPIYKEKRELVLGFRINLSEEAVLRESYFFEFFGNSALAY